MVKLLFLRAAEWGGRLIIRPMGDDGYLMVVELPEEAGFPVNALAVRVDSPLKLDDGATWLLGQLSVRTIAEIADWVAGEDVSIQAGSCEACGSGAVYTIDQQIDCDASVSENATAHGISPTSKSQLILSAALQLSIVASQVSEGELSPEQVQSELLRMSKLLSDGVHDETGLRSA